MIPPIQPMPILEADTGNLRLHLAAQFVAALSHPDQHPDAATLIIELALLMADKLIEKERETR